MKNFKLPFEPTRHLKIELIEKYLHPAINWLADINDKNVATVLPVKLGNVWEAAYVIITIYNAKPILEDASRFSGEYLKRISFSIGYLLDKVREDSVAANWDGGLYDTAVALRALMYYFLNSESTEDLDHIKALIEKGLFWLCREIESWELERYSLGVADLAQTLQTFVLWESISKKSINVSLAEKGAQFRHNNLGVKEYIVDQLILSFPGGDILNMSMPDDKLNEPPVLPLPHNSFDTKTTKKDTWNISEAIIALVEYYCSNLSKTDTLRLSKIANFIHLGIRFLEVEHSDGKWGLPDTTSLALVAYLRGLSIWEKNIEPQPHIVFKTIRWLCDDKQFFLDGSILHNTTHTLFFSISVITVCDQWLSARGGLDIPVVDLYDYIIWQMPSRTSTERAKRLETQDKLEKSELLIRKYQSDLNAVRKQVTRWKLTFFILAWAVVGIILSVLFGFLNFKIVEITRIPLPSFSITGWQEFLALVSLWISLGIIFGGRIARSIKSKEQSTEETSFLL